MQCIHIFLLHVRYFSFHSRGYRTSSLSGKWKLKLDVRCFCMNQNNYFNLLASPFPRHTLELFFFSLKSSALNLKNNGLCLYEFSLSKRNSFFKFNCKLFLNTYHLYQWKIEKIWTEKRLKIHQRLLQWKPDKYARTVKNMNQMSKDMMLIAS